MRNFSGILAKDYCNSYYMNFLRIPTEIPLNNVPRVAWEFPSGFRYFSRFFSEGLNFPKIPGNRLEESFENSWWWLWRLLEDFFKFSGMIPGQTILKHFLYLMRNIWMNSWENTRRNPFRCFFNSYKRSWETSVGTLKVIPRSNCLRSCWKDSCKNPRKSLRKNLLNMSTQMPD